MTQASDAGTGEVLKTLTYGDRTLSLWDWRRDPAVCALKLTPGVLYKRQRLGWSDARALTTPLRPEKAATLPCRGCKRVFPRAELSRVLKCPACAGMRLNESTDAAAVSAGLPWLEDYAARALVVHHPDGMTLEQVGQAFGVTRERIRQIEAIAAKRFLVSCRKLGLDPAELLSAIRERNVDGQENLERRNPPPVKRAPVQEDDAPVPENGKPESAEARALDAAITAFERAAARFDAAIRPVEGDLITNGELERRRALRAEESDMRATRLIEWQGETKSAGKWAEDPRVHALHLTSNAIDRRVQALGWTAEEALTTPRGELPERIATLRALVVAPRPADPQATKVAPPTPKAPLPAPVAQEPAQAVRDVLTSLDPVDLLRRLGWTVDELGDAPAGRLLVIKGGSAA